MLTQPKIAAIESPQIRTDLSPYRVGDTVRVHYKIVEGEKERIQVFQGVIIRSRHAGLRSTFTVRKISFGVGVERIFSTNSPFIGRIEVVSHGIVRRARLYYLRDLSGKKARLKARRDQAPTPHAAEPVAPVEPIAQPEPTV
jgi:large subunit ribosomal protein L19